ncbi:MAG TPA: hydantoinase B/oxoprolinase family protein [Ktedonobacteraceae bacterium]|nr:hydantoinase B/oxoprolinase family protein [Ktedonobacteraceae bacterium]
MEQERERGLRAGMIGVDIGGTFTDIVQYAPSTDGGAAQLRIFKVPSTPQDPAQGLLAGLRALQVEPGSVVIHGTTVATNALLERKGARAALVTTKGFADVLEIGRQNRPALYDLMQQRPPALIPRERRFELAERLDYHGNVLQAPTDEAFERLLQQLVACQPESIAISLLYAFRNPAHEQALAALLRDRFPDVYLSLSSEILPQFREYERTSTVAVNAYVQPLMARYLYNVQDRVNGPLRIMQSSGGSISAAVAAREPVRTVLSGPAGGVIGAFHSAKLAGHEQIITLDMGGTSTDVALCPGVIPETSEASVGGSPVSVPTVAIHTVGAGGGSIVRLDEGNALTVGPESAGAFPGPACYGVGDELTVTDANLVLGRIDPAYFLGGRFTLYPQRAQERIEQLAQRMGVSVQEAALGVIRVVNASMERALRQVSLEQGYDPRLFTLLPFGGAGPLHACELAESLHIPRLFIPRYPGVLSALGMLLAPIVKDYVQTVMLPAQELDAGAVEKVFVPLREQAHADMERERQALASQEGIQISFQRLYDLRYAGQAYELTTPDSGSLDETLARFHALHEQRYGHSHPEQPVQIVAVRVKAILQPQQPDLPAMPYDGLSPERALLGERPMIFASGEHMAHIYDRERLRHGNHIVGPALLVQGDSTILLPPDWEGQIDAYGNINARFTGSGIKSQFIAPRLSVGIDSASPSPVSLEIFKHLFASAAEEMGVTLGRTAYSPNIKERKDYSCACFDAQGRLIAQAEHIPVHLGAMPASVRAAIEQFSAFEPGDIVILNDPYLGGTHLPDITLVAPVFIANDPDGRSGALFGFTASRAHHADIGGMSPGSMPMSRELYQEGVIIPPLKLAKGGVLNEELLQLFYRNVRTPWERKGDMDAQIAAARVGELRLHEIISRYGSRTVQAHVDALLDYSTQLTRSTLALLSENEVEFTDYLDDDGWSVESLPIHVRMRAKDGNIVIDFSGSAPQSAGCVNAVEAVTVSAVLYAIRCLVGERVPTNQGCLEPVRIFVPRGTLLNPKQPAAVAAGNVETSQRVVDTLFGALTQLAPEKIPAASQGTMNNLTLGGYDAEQDKVFAYYETMGGGMGARPGAHGLSGVHVHMSNTRNTPVEALEMELPIRVLSYGLRRDSGGVGRYRGGDGLRREIQFLVPATVTLLTDRRKRAPYGLYGGKPGAPGINTLEHAGKVTELPGKVTVDVQTGDILTICTPGGGGFLPEEGSHVDKSD